MIFHFPHWVVSFVSVHSTSHALAVYFFRAAVLSGFSFFFFFASENFPPFTHFTSIWLDRLFRATRAWQPGGVEGGGGRGQQQRHASCFVFPTAPHEHARSIPYRMGYADVLVAFVGLEKSEGIFLCILIFMRYIYKPFLVIYFNNSELYFLIKYIYLCIYLYTISIWASIAFFNRQIWIQFSNEVYILV